MIGSTIKLPPEAEALHYARLDFAEQADLMLKGADAAKARILHLMGEASVGLLPNGGGYRHMSLLRDLQEMHDANLPEEWPAVLREIACRHHLNANVVTHCERVYGRPFIAPPEPQPVAPAYLLDLAAIMKVAVAVNVGVDHGSEEREEAREVCCT